MGYHDKGMLISPKSPRSYAAAYQIQSFAHNLAGMKAIQQRLEAARDRQQ